MNKGGIVAFLSNHHTGRSLQYVISVSLLRRVNVYKLATTPSAYFQNTWRRRVGIIFLKSWFFAFKWGYKHILSQSLNLTCHTPKYSSGEIFQPSNGDDQLVIFIRCTKCTNPWCRVGLIGVHCLTFPIMMYKTKTPMSLQPLTLLKPTVSAASLLLSHCYPPIKSVLHLMTQCYSAAITS